MNARKIWTPDEAAKFLNQFQSVSDAQSFEGNTQQPPEFLKKTITLTGGTAVPRGQALEVNFPFRSVYVLSSTHPSINVKLIPYSISQELDEIQLYVSDAVDFGRQISKGYIFYDAQSPLGANSPVTSIQITLLFSVHSVFNPASIASVKGGVKTDMYYSCYHLPVTLAATTSTNISDPAGFSVVPSYTTGLDRSVLVQNQTGAVLYLGADSAVDDGSAAAGIHKGFKLQDGDFYKWNNKQYLYAWSAAGGSIVTEIEF